MSIHSIIAKLKYRLQAKRLHGVHSPFAYTFSEEILYTTDKPHLPTLPTVRLPAKYQQLLARLKDKRHYTDQCALSAEHDDSLSGKDIIIITEKNPGLWLQLFNKHLPELKSDCVIAVPGIHTTKRHSLKWKRLYTHPKILMSIDLYGLGLIFFKPEFKEKQHFILKY